MTTPKMHVKKGDQVVLLSGKDKGKRGNVLVAMPREGRVIVEGVNIIKRHTRPSARNQHGGIIEREAPVYAAKVMLVCKNCHKPSRTGSKVLADGTHVRFCKKCGEVLDK